LPLGDEGLAGVAVPVLAVSVEGDDLGPVAAVDALAHKLPAATVTRVHIDEPGIDHFRWARQMEPVVPVISDWLASLR
jgi:predicted alpha/beta hydrolase